MSFSFCDQSPDSLTTLLKKVNAVKTINQENLAFIQSRKGHDVITKQSFTLKTKCSTNDDEDFDDGTDEYGKLSTQEQIELNTNKQSENSKKAVATKKRSKETYDDDQSKRKKFKSQNTTFVLRQST